MDTQPVRSLLIHGSIVLLLGLLSGIPFWIAIIKGRDDTAIRPWRVAHATLISCGLVMIAVSLISPRPVLSESLRSLLQWLFIISGYGFVFALVIGAATGYRALTPTPAGFNTLLFIGHLIGVVGALLGICLVLYGLL